MRIVTVKHAYRHLLVSSGNVMAEINRNIRYLCSDNIVTVIPAAMQDRVHATRARVPTSDISDLFDYAQRGGVSGLPNLRSPFIPRGPT